MTVTSPSSRCRAAALLVGALVAAAAFAPAASADTEVSLSGTTLRVIGGVLQRQETVIQLDSGLYRVTENSTSNPREDAGTGCAQVNPRVVTCSASGVQKIDVDPKDKNDVVTVQPNVTIPVAFQGGEGDDIMTGGSGDDNFFSQPDKDGADQFYGGAGQDSVNYTDRLRPVTVSLDSHSNDGTGTEGDFISSSIEKVGGGKENDTLIGNDAPNVLNGGAGNDDITGGGGADTLDGSFGNDTLRDDLDRIKDIYRCGDGSDIAFLDLVDSASGFPVGDCEQVFSSAIDQHPNVVIRVKAVARLDRHGRVHLGLVCPKAQRHGCSGRLTLRRRKHTLGSRRYSLHPGKRTTIVLRLSPGEVRRVQSMTGTSVSAWALERDPQGRPKTSIHSFRLKPAR